MRLRRTPTRGGRRNCRPALSAELGSLLGGKWSGAGLGHTGLTKALEAPPLAHRGPPWQKSRSNQLLTLL